MNPPLDSTFNALPLHLQRKIDRAFDSAVEWTRLNNNRSEEQISDAQGDSGGGFLFAESTLQEGSFLDEDAAKLDMNGFMAEDPITIQTGPPAQIPLSSIPLGLQHLDLPPDDEQVLSVFRNAASGWSSSSNTIDDISPGGGMVNRDDWRTVCAVLLERHTEEYQESNNGKTEDMESDDDLNSHDHSSQYSDPGTPSDSDDEYVERPDVSSPRRRRIHISMNDSAPSSPSTSQREVLTPRQKQTCFEIFALFLPSIPLSELANHRITIKDIQRVSKVLGEKIKSDEMLEMLEAFSSSSDKSMSLEDFSNMMVAAKLA